jgi:hypothetical protein
MVRYLYDHGLPFSNTLAPNLDDLQKRINKKKASLMIISGGVGEGKTTLAVHVADYVNKINGRPPITFDGPQMAMGGVDFLKKLRVCYDDKQPCIIYDEAGDFSKRSALTRFNAMINRTFETFRAFKCLVIICLPNFDILDNQLFDNQIPRLLLRCHDRTEHSGNFDGYGLNEMLFLKYWFKKSPIKNYAFGRTYPNFNGHFLDLEPARSKELDIISMKNKKEILKRSEIKIEGLIAYPELAEKLNITINYVRALVGKLKLKPARVVDRVKYFSPDHLAQLAELIDDQEKRGRPRFKEE